MMESHYCDLCGCVCVACVQVADGCSSCELKHPELIPESASEFTETLLDAFCL